MIQYDNGFDLQDETDSNLSSRAERILNDYCSGKLDLDFTIDDIIDE